MIESVLPNYYQDGEEAYFMKKALPGAVTYAASPTGPFFGRAKGRDPPFLENLPSRRIDRQPNPVGQDRPPALGGPLGEVNSRE